MTDPTIRRQRELEQRQRREQRRLAEEQARVRTVLSDKAAARDRQRQDFLQRSDYLINQLDARLGRVQRALEALPPRWW
jgi:hypothetical protein